MGRHRALRPGADDVRPGGVDLPLRRQGDPIPRPSDVVFGGQLRLCQSAVERGVEAADRPAAPAGLPVPAQGENPPRRQARAQGRVDLRGEGPDPFQCWRRQRGRRRLEGRAEPDEEELRVRLHGRVSRAHARGLGDHVQLPLPGEVRSLCRPGEFHPVSLLLPLSLRSEARILRDVLLETIRAPVRNRVLRRGEQSGQGGVWGLLHRSGSGDGRLCRPARGVFSGSQEDP